MDLAQGQGALRSISDAESCPMGIHQIQVRYDAAADRLLLQVRTTEAEIYAVWLTRRMTSRLYAPFRQTVASVGVAQASPQALPVPEAREMLEQAALQRPLPGADFRQAFAATDSTRPLGAEPMLPTAVDLRPQPGGGLMLALREDQGRRLDMTLTADLATALLRLVDAALQQSEWNLPMPSQAAAATAAVSVEGGEPGIDPAKGRLLN